MMNHIVFPFMERSSVTFLHSAKMKNRLLLLLLSLLLHNALSLPSHDKGEIEGKGREVINFDFAWRFRHGNYDSVTCPESNFPYEFNYLQCSGLFLVSSAKTEEECAQACCANIMCSIWQWSILHDKGCWIGSTTDCVVPNPPSKEWIGRGGRIVPATPPAPATGGRTSRYYDDSEWEIVDLPHDALIGGEYHEDGPRGQGYLLKNVTWYRKHFMLPTDWKAKVIWVYFEGVFRASNVYLNGELLHYEDSGYTSFAVRLDNASSLYYGEGQENENVLVVYCSPNFGYSGWWYEGGGIYRHTYLVATDILHFIPDGIYVQTSVKGGFHPHFPDDSRKGDYVDSVTLNVGMEVINNGIEEQSKFYRLTLIDVDGKEINSTLDGPFTFHAGQNMTLKGSMTIENAEVWGPARPYLYTMKCDLWAGVVTDTVNITFGVRSTRWDANQGFFLNNIHFTWRGFNNHNDFTGVGVAVPDRINLFRAQSMRAVGANSWRMSHNPPIPVMLDIMDNIGIIVWDENREFGNSSIWIANQKNMVMRDRNHPSVMIWSFCNEAGCVRGNEEGDIARAFKAVSKQADPTRQVSANMNSDIGGGLTSQLDVQGFSHQNGSIFDNFHRQMQNHNKPTIGSECCSCTTQRGEDFPDRTRYILGNFNADCNKEETENQLNRSFVAGCMVWTLFDYYGEPSFGGWPHISSSFGSIDLAGFAKASAYWYRSWWLYNEMDNPSTGGIDVPLDPPKLVNPDATPSEENDKDGYLVHIVQHWEKNEDEETRTIQVYTNAPSAELSVNGKSLGVKDIVLRGWAEWTDVQFVPGYITATAFDGENAIVATHTVVTTGEAEKIEAFVDVPSKETGTGTALLLDGQDAGMVSAALLDATGRVAHSSSLNVSFSIVSGPGRIIGVGNGNPTCHEPNQATWRSAYHGLARAIIQVTEDHVTPNRDRIIEIDRDEGKRTLIGDPRVPRESLDDIVVQVSAPGVGSATVTIPVSTEPNEGVLSTAKKSRQ